MELARPYSPREGPHQNFAHEDNMSTGSGKTLISSSLMPPATLDLYIAEKFGAVGIRFHHAENLHNFYIYCEHQALLARTELRRLSQSYTRFYSDESDERRGALSRVFGNLRDFGVIMASGRNTIPNVYGPIQLVFSSGAFAAMSDVVITKNSVVTLGDAWRAQAANSRATIDMISAGRSSDGHVARDWTYAEISAAEARLSFDLLERVIVEPIAVAGQPLLRLVQTALHMAGYGGIPVVERSFVRAESLAALRAAVEYSDRLPDGLTEDSEAFAALMNLPEFSQCTPPVQRRLPLWARYFYFGTVTEVRTRYRQLQKAMEDADAADTREACELCDPGEDRSPAMVTFGPLYIDGVRSRLLEEGLCDNCNGITLRCLECGESTPIWPRMGRQDFECGGCDLRFVVVRTDTHDGTTLDVEIEGAITPETLGEELEAILLAKHEGEFEQAVLEGDYPVCNVELDQLTIELGNNPGVATVEWGFTADHHSEDGIYFGGVVTAELSFPGEVATRDALIDGLRVHRVEADFDMGGLDEE